MPTKYVSSPSQAQDWNIAMEPTEKGTQQQTKQFLSKPSLLAICHSAEGIQVTFFNFSDAIQNLHKSAVKPQLVLSFITYHKKPQNIWKIYVEEVLTE